MGRIIASAVFCFYLAATLPAVSAGDDVGDADEGSACTRLSVSSFDSYIAGQREAGRATLVMFHVGWCKVCQRLFPEFKAAAGAMAKKNADVPLNFAHVDCEKDKPVCSRFELTGYPSIKLFGPDPSSEPRSYKGLRSQHGFVKYAERMTQPPVLRLPNGRKDFDKVALDESFAVFAVEVPEGEEANDALRDAAAARMDRHRFCAAGSLRDLVPEAIEVPEGAKMAVVVRGALQWPAGGRGNPHKSPPVANFFMGNVDKSDEVKGWIQLNRFPGIWTISDSNFYEFSHADRSAVIVAVDPAKMTPELEEAIRSAASALADDFIFGVINAVAFTDSLADFGIVKDELPRVLVTESNFELWVEDAEALTAANLEADLRSLLAGAPPLLRQGRNVRTKLLLYKRRAFRYALQLREYAEQGPKECALVGLGAIAALALLFVAGKLMMMLCGALVGDFDDDVAFGFDGYWHIDHGKGKLEHIANGQMRGVASYTELDDSRCSATFDSKQVTGILSPCCKRIAWSDGDVWHRQDRFESEWAAAEARIGQNTPKREDPLKRD